MGHLATRLAADCRMLYGVKPFGESRHCTSGCFGWEDGVEIRSVISFAVLGGDRGCGAGVNVLLIFAIVHFVTCRWPSS